MNARAATILSLLGVVFLAGCGKDVASPEHQASWVATSGPGGGSITSWAVNGTTLFAGTTGGGSLSIER
jgi:hypothetical protein